LQLPAAPARTSAGARPKGACTRPPAGHGLPLKLGAALDGGRAAGPTAGSAGAAHLVAGGPGGMQCPPAGGRRAEPSARKLRYKAWGEDRYTSGTTPTSFRYTGQRNEAYTEFGGFYCAPVGMQVDERPSSGIGSPHPGIAQ